MRFSFTKIIVVLMLIFLSSCSDIDDQGGLRDKAEKIFQNSNTVYYEVAKYKAFGDTYPVLMSSIDATMPAVSYLSETKEILRNFDLSNYQECDSAASEQAFLVRFYLEDETEKVQVEIGSNEDSTQMVISFLFENGESLHLKGEYSADLYWVGNLKGAIQTIYESCEGAVIATRLGKNDKAYILSRGVSAKIISVIEVVEKNIMPVSDDTANYNIKLEIVPNRIYFIDTELCLFQKEGDENVYYVKEEALCNLIRSIPNTLK